MSSCESLPLDPKDVKDVKDVKERYDFDPVMTFLERMLQACGGPGPFEEAFVRFEPTSPDTVALGPA